MFVENPDLRCRERQADALLFSQLILGRRAVTIEASVDPYRSNSLPSPMYSTIRTFMVWDNGAVPTMTHFSELWLKAWTASPIAKSELKWVGTM